MRLLLWLAAATATDDRRQLSARDRQTTKGLLANDVERTPQRWVFVHVPKAAGASFFVTKPITVEAFRKNLSRFVR